MVLVLSGHTSGVIQHVLLLDLRSRLAAAVQGVPGAAGTLSAVPFPAAGETQQVHCPPQSVSFTLQGKRLWLCPGMQTIYTCLFNYLIKFLLTVLASITDSVCQELHVQLCLIQF